MTAQDGTMTMQTGFGIFLLILVGALVVAVLVLLGYVFHLRDERRMLKSQLDVERSIVDRHRDATQLAREQRLETERHNDELTTLACDFSDRLAKMRTKQYLKLRIERRLARIK